MSSGSDPHVSCQNPQVRVHLSNFCLFSELHLFGAPKSRPSGSSPAAGRPELGCAHLEGGTEGSTMIEVRPSLDQRPTVPENVSGFNDFFSVEPTNS